MYKIGEQFIVDYESAKVNPKCVVMGRNYRITVMTERLVRLEYNENGNFLDRPTQFAWHRDLGITDFKIKQDSKYIEITTKYFCLTYLKEKPFGSTKINPTANLKVELLGSDRVWYYGHPEVRNYGSPGLELYEKKKNDKKHKAKYKKGLYSIDGFVSIDDSKSMIIEETGSVIERNSEKDNVDIYLFMYYKNFQGCLNDYYRLTGYPALIPRYALGNWWSRNISYNDDTLKDLVNNFEAKNIPLSVLVLNNEWHLNKYEDTSNIKTGFTFNNNLIKNPHETISYLHSKGIRLGLNIDPSDGIYPYEVYYNKICEYLQVTPGTVIPFNVLDPKFLDVYLKLLIHPLDNLDVDFFWLDYTYPKNKQELWILNHYHFYDMMRNYKRRPMLLTTNSLIAPHRYPVLYSGKSTVSWETLKLIPIHNASAANNGVSWWSHDIGGFYKGIEDDELYTRYVQLGTFSPILKFGSEKGKYYRREPWKWGYKTYNIVRDYLKLRHRLIPYLYTEAYKYHKHGIPVIQPIYYKNPEMYDDPLYRNEYYLGSELFICPIINKKEPVMQRVIHRFYMPDGVWYDFVTGKKFPGGKNYVSFFKDNDYPVFAKAGSIIVLGDNENMNDTTPPKNMEIQIFPGRSNRYDMYEDDGVSDLYKTGYYLKSSIEYNYLPNNYTVIIRALEGKSGIVPEKRNYKIRFRNTKEAKDVIIYFNNEPLTYQSYVENTDFIVEIKDVPTIGQLTLNCKGKNIEIDAVRLINEEIQSILYDLQIETEMKETIDQIIFSELPIKKKRIALRKLRKVGLGRKFIRLFLKLLEYISEV